MLKEQAISLLTQVKEIILGSESWLDSTHQPIEEAFSMAIEAIKSMQHNTPNVLNALDCISRQAAIDAMMALQAEDDEAYGCHIPEGFDGERELIDRAVKALETEFATKTCNKQIASKLEDAELARDSEKTCNNKQVSCK